ncbi:hypothetical protein ACH4U6_21795 [Streptomyces netropsis]|uniref:hypothetical protein n=1 Tax=Streptomyces netropsis TaxID=55404 RepID=UPI0037A5CCFA
MREVSGEPRLRARLAGRLTDLTVGLGVTAGRARALTDHFGQGGTRKAAEAVLGWFELRACPVDLG